jgi:hypothetical protein
MPLDVLQTMLRVNVEGVFIVRRAILPHMITQRLGSVVNLAWSRRRRSPAPFKGAGWGGGDAAGSERVVSGRRWPVSSLALVATRASVLSPSQTLPHHQGGAFNGPEVNMFRNPSVTRGKLREPHRGEHEGVGFMLADNAMDIHQSRLVIWHAAWVLDEGQRGTHESSMAKVICSEAIWRVVDRSMQILGGLGVTDDPIVARLFRDVRPFRIYDGPSEVHRWSIARRCCGREERAEQNHDRNAPQRHRGHRGKSFNSAFGGVGWRLPG